MKIFKKKKKKTCHNCKHFSCWRPVTRVGSGWCDNPKHPYVEYNPQVSSNNTYHRWEEYILLEK